MFRPNATLLRRSSYRYDDFPSAEIDTSPLPERCQFMFSDGRQCTMGRSDIHPSLCPYHSEREDQLFGTPSSGGSVVGAGFDLPELYSACRDLTTAAGVNRALAQVFRLLAQRRIPRQEAATFAKLGHLLLQSISAARTESVAAPLDGGRAHSTSPVILSEERRISPGVPQDVNCARREQPALTNVPPSPPPTILAESEPSPERNAKNSLGINTSTDSIRNSREINTSEIAGLKIAQNQHLQKNSGDDPISESSSIKLGRTGSKGAERVPDNHENGRKT